MHRGNIPRVPEEETRADRVRTNRPHLPFGSDNLFPQAVAELNRKAANHRAIINNKTIYVTGRGFAFDENNARLADVVQEANGEGETLRSVFRKLALDYNVGGNAYLVLSTDAPRSFMSFTHVDWTKGRVAKERDAIIFHPKWSKYQSTKNLIKRIPLYPEFEEVDGALRSVIHYKDYEPEFSDYGVVSWIAAMDAAGIAYKTNKWNLSRLDNSFQTSGIVMVDGKIGETDALELQKRFKSELVGEGKQGNVMFVVKHLGGGGTTFTPIGDSAEGDWIKLHGQSDQDLIMAHNWFPSLSGLAQPGQLGNTQQILNEYEIAQNTVVGDLQSFLLDPITMAMETELGIDASSLEVINQAPVSILGKLDLNAITMVKEGRRMAGLDDLEETDERGAEFIKPTQNSGTITFGE